MALTNAERQARYRKRELEVGNCATGGCQQVAHPYRKCALCRRKEADQKAAKRRASTAEQQELGQLRDRVQELEEQNAWLVQQVAALNKYNILATEFDDMMASLKDEYGDEEEWGIDPEP